jgi:hypothetical protein
LTQFIDLHIVPRNANGNPSPANSEYVDGSGKNKEATMTLLLLGNINGLIRKRIQAIEMIGVLMRIISFTLVSWLGPQSPFMFVWIFNTSDAVILSWCSILKRDKAYTVLNCFWIAIGIMGIFRASGFAH